MFVGIIYALIAGMMWGLVFVSPLLLPEYPPVLQSVGRYLAFGLIALPLAWLDRRRLSQLSRADWKEALRLAAIARGNSENMNSVVARRAESADFAPLVRGREE